MTFGAALMQIEVADVSMVRSTISSRWPAPPKGQLWVLVLGLAVAVAFMGLLSAFIAKLLARYHWITWIGLLIVLYVALEMIGPATHQVGCEFVSRAACEGGVWSTLRAVLS